MSSFFFHVGHPGCGGWLGFLLLIAPYCRDPILCTSFQCACLCSVALLLCSTSRPDVALLWFLIPLKAVKHLVCDQYRWLTIKIVAALLLLAILALFLYNMPGYMVKKLLGAWDIHTQRNRTVCRLLVSVVSLKSNFAILQKTSVQH